MKFLPILAVGTVTSTSVLAATIPPVKRGSSNGKFLVEFEHGKSEWVTESDKWELIRVCLWQLQSLFYPGGGCRDY